MELFRNIDWISDLIPDLDVRIGQFAVDAEEMDDELTEVFFGELHRLAGELQEGLGRGDADEVRMAAHSIKGMGGTIGLPELSVLGQEIENIAKASRLQATAPLIGALGAWVDNF